MQIPLRSRLSMEDRAAILALGDKIEPGQPITLRHSIFVPENFDAETIAYTLRRDGYATGVGISGFKNYWLVLVQKQINDILEELPDARRDLEKIAEKYNGEYKGWEIATEA